MLFYIGVEIGDPPQRQNYKIHLNRNMHSCLQDEH